MEVLKKLSGKKGFSLIEVIIVVTVIALLILAAIVSMKPQLLKARSSRKKADIGKIAVAVEEYEKDNNCYPPQELVLCVGDRGSNGTGLAPYLSTVPCEYGTKGTSYYYYPEPGTECSSWYKIYGYLEYDKDPDISEYLCQFGCTPYVYNYYKGSPNAPLPTESVARQYVEVPSSTPTASTIPGSQLYGCFDGDCLPISEVNPCEPNFGNSTCYSQCVSSETGAPINECQ